jgi:tetratricopeptide (TPR) repeat protein
MSRLLLAALVVVLPLTAVAQPKAETAYEKNRRYAFELYDEGKVLQAIPLLEELTLQNPQDVDVRAKLGIALLHRGYVDKAEDARKIRIYARDLLVKAKEAGSKEALLDYYIESVPSDGSLPTFSAKKEVEEAMREGEAAFVSRDFEKAKNAYLRAYLMDPSDYHATLFLGDVYFAQKQYGAAIEWFSAATKLQPDWETAYRYWGDALLYMNKHKEAREKFIEAYILDPYGRTAPNGLLNFGRVLKLQLAHPNIQSPNSIKKDEKKANTTNIVIDASTLETKDGRSAWLIYEISRAAWEAKRFKEKFPNEKEYRRSLPEEAGALRLVAENAKAQLKDKKIEKLDPSLQSLVNLHDDGLIEPYVLLARADAGIAQDYAAYLRENRDKLRAYVAKYVVPEPPADAPE